MTIRRAVAVALLSSGLMAQTRPADVLTRAREAYNTEQYDQAIELAGEARQLPTQREGAGIIFARAHLERYRRTSQASDLDAAREAIKTIDVGTLGARERVELLIALGTSLYLDQTYTLDDRFSAAAEQFELALAQAGVLDGRSREQLFDWWAGSLDRQAQQGGEAGRPPIYERILAGAERELSAEPYSASASYWLAAAARGTNDLTRAVGAAVAGWVRAEALGPRGESLQLDLDRLMRQVILPERAREMVPNGDPRPTLALLEAQWDQVKNKWTR
jgi:hypothetical protein